MPRLPRQYVPGLPNHVIQRGNNRARCFFTESDRAVYLAWLRQAAEENGCSVHAYVLMTNHVHLLMTPNTEESIPRTLQSLGRRYVQHVNRQQGRTGTLWEGRPKASLVESERYLFACSRYIEMNPVRAGIAPEPALHPWSSYGRNALGLHDPLVRPHGLYEALGANPAERRAAYRGLFEAVPDYDEISEIRKAINGCLPLGTARFKNALPALMPGQNAHSGTPFVG